jgi:hypothetical protein
MKAYISPGYICAARALEMDTVLVIPGAAATPWDSTSPASTVNRGGRTL